MPCYQPLLGIPEYKSENGDWCFVPRGKYDSKIALTWTWTSEENKFGDRPKPILIPCGKCLGCRLNYSRSWADRMMLELDSNNGKAIFVTLTYNNEHIPPQYNENDELTGFTLYKRDLQLFFKRLRKAYPEITLRYYATGEYGSFNNTGRPHYHAIIFGISIDDFPKNHVHYLGQNELHQPYYRVDDIERCWSVVSHLAIPGKRVNFLKGRYKKVYEPIGYVVVAEVSWLTCAYVARYVQKKVFHSHQAMIDNLGLAPEFSVMSRNPGIAGNYLSDHPELFDYSILHPKVCPEKIYVPSYFLKKMKLTDRDRYDSIMSERRQFMDDKVFLKTLNSELSYLEQLEVEQDQKFKQVTALRRML